MKKILLDTNAYTAFLKGDESILDALAQAKTVFMSVFVLGERKRPCDHPRELA